jgi:hypothetical protein
MSDQGHPLAEIPRFFVRRPLNQRLAAWRNRSSSELPVGLAVVTGGSIVALALLRSTSSIGGPVVAFLQLILVIGLVALVVIEYRLALGIAIWELVLGGAGGRWTEIHGLSGRVAIDAIVLAAALVRLKPALSIRQRRFGYTTHAIGIAVLMGLLWIPLGWANGYGAHAVFDDGNGMLFMAFILAIDALTHERRWDWLRRCVLGACVANAIFLAAVLLLTVSGAVSVRPTLDDRLLGRLGLGGVVGTLPSGIPRISPGNALYLVVGIALVTALLLRTPRRPLTWAVFALMWTDLAATSTRGLWLGGIIAAIVTAVVGTGSMRRSVVVVSATAAGLAVAFTSLALADPPLAHYFKGRLTSSTTTKTQPTKDVRFTPGSLVQTFTEGTAGWSSVPGKSIDQDRSVKFRGLPTLRLTYHSGTDTNLGYTTLVVPAGRWKVVAWVKIPDRWQGGTVRLSAENYVGAGGPLAGTADMSVRGRWQPLRVTVVPTKDRGGNLVIRAIPRPVSGEHLWVGAISVRPALIANGSFENNTTGWTAPPGKQISRSTLTAKEGVASARLRYFSGRDSNLAYSFVGLPPVPVTLEAWVFVPRTWPGSLALSAEGFLRPIGRTLVIARPRRNTMQRITLTFTPRRRGTSGYVVFRATQLPRAGASVWIDGVRATVSTRTLVGSHLLQLATGGIEGEDTLGVRSNQFKVHEAHILWRYIQKKPVIGYGFGAVAPGIRSAKACSPAWHCDKPYSYELSYLNLLFKVGLLGLILFLSFHLRVLADGVRLRIRLAKRPDVPEGALAVGDIGSAVGMVAALLVTGATNPWVIAAFGIFPLLFAATQVQDAKRRLDPAVGPTARD